MRSLGEILALVSSAFSEQGIAYVLVGGHAVNIHGVTRATGDVDFMICENDEDAVRALMRESGFTSQSSHELVVFCQEPDSPLRLDFLKVDSETLSRVLEEHVVVDAMGNCPLPVAGVRSLIAMKLTALRANLKRRQYKDLPDVVGLAKQNGLALEADLLPMIARYGSPEVEARIREAWEAME